MAGIAVALVLWGLLVLSFMRLPIMHPLQIWFGSWAIGVGLYALKLLPYVDLGAEATVLLLVCVLAFGCGVLVAERLMPRRPPGPARAKRPVTALAATAALAAAGLGLAFFLLEVARDFGWSSALGFDSDVRHALIEERIAPPYYIHFSMTATALCALTAGLSPERDTRRRWAAWSAVAVASLYFSTGRGLLAAGAITAVVAYGLAVPRWVTHRSAAYAAGALAALTVVVLVVLGHIAGTKWFNSDIPSFKNAFSRNAAISELALPYEHASASVAAFSELVRVSRPWGRARGCATFPSVCKFGRRLGMDLRPEPATRPFTAPPLPWNTYTFLDAPLIDFGRVLAPLLVMLLGTAVGVIWVLSRSGILAAQAAYAFVVAGLIFAARQNFAEQMMQWGTLTFVLLLSARAAIGVRNQGRRRRQLAPRPT